MPEEPHAWESKEFLRRLSIGKPCTFRVDYKVEQLGGREFGTVYIGDQNVGVLCVEAGWAKINERDAERNPFHEQLVQSEEQARKQKLGIHGDESSFCPRSQGSLEDASSLMKRHGKGGAMSVIVDAVISGSLLAVTVPETRKGFVVMVAGIQCPHMGQGKPEQGPQPYAREAKWLAESLCLNREVTLVMYDVLEKGALLSSVHIPHSNKEKDARGKEYDDLAERLLHAGLAKIVEWSLTMIPQGAFALKEIERSAKSSRRCIWHDHVPQSNNSPIMHDQFSGMVMEIVSGDCIVVMDDVHGTERRVILSSIRAPKAATRDRSGEAWGQESKDFLRKRLIGKVVHVTMEYSRDFPKQDKAVPKQQDNSKGAPATKQESRMNFGTVLYKSESGEVIFNAAAMMLSEGLASIVHHGSDDERSSCFEDLIKAQEEGKAKGKGIHSKKEAPMVRYNDLSSGSKAARQHLPFLQRAGKMSAICDYVINGSKLKLYVPKQSVMISFSPSGVRCPGRGEEFSEEALAFTRSRFLQRNVIIEVENVDRVGTFLGRVTTTYRNSECDLGTSLLERGLAKLHDRDAQGPGSRDLKEAQDKAKAAKSGIWSIHEEGADTKEPAIQQPARELKSIVLTEMVNPNTFYVQYVDDTKAGWIADQLQGAMPMGSQPVDSTIKPGSLCVAKFDVDAKWYRAKILNVRNTQQPTYEVLFIDYGNKSSVSRQSLCTMPRALTSVPPQAQMATLACTWVPVNAWDDIGGPVANRIADLTAHGTRKLAGFKEAMSTTSDGNVIHHLTLFPGEEQRGINDTINADLIRHGMAKSVELPPGVNTPETRDLYQTLRILETQALHSHTGIFQYGDVDSDEEYDDLFH